MPNYAIWSNAFPVFFTSLLIATAFFVPYGAGIILLFGFVPFLLFLKKSLLSYPRVGIISFFAGVIFFSFTLSWLFAVLPLDWAGIEHGWTGLIIFFLVWLVIIVSFSFWWGIFAVGSAFLFRGQKGILHPLLSIPSLWVLTEFLRSFTFGLIWFSRDQSVIGPDWTFGNIAYALGENSFTIIARYGGIYAINFFILFANMIIVILLTRANREKNLLKNSVVPIGVCISLFFFGYLIKLFDRTIFFTEDLFQPEKRISVAALSTNVPRSFSLSPLEQEEKQKKIARLLKTINRNIHVIVLPETAEFISPAIYQDSELVRTLQQQDPLIIDHRSGPISQTIYWRLSSSTIARQNKELLMPGGEYLPLVLHKMLVFLGNKSLVVTYNETRTLFQARKEPFVSDTLGNISSFLCSEVMSSRLTRRGARENAHIFFLQTSDAIFQGNKQYLKQMIAMAQVRAVEAGKFVIRSSNKGTSAIIDPFGRVLQSLPPGEGMLIGDVYLLDEKTPYTVAGDLPILGFSLITLLYMIRIRK